MAVNTCIAFATKKEEIVDIDLCVGVRPRKKRRQTRRTKVTVQQT